MRSCCQERLSSLFVFLGQRLIFVGCLMIMVVAVGCGGALWCFGAGCDAYCWCCAPALVAWVSVQVEHTSDAPLHPSFSLLDLRALSHPSVPHIPRCYFVTSSFWVFHMWLCPPAWCHYCHCSPCPSLIWYIVPCNLVITETLLPI